MIKNVVFKEPETHAALYPLFAGQQHCAYGHRFGPHVRSYYLIHFCLSGKGTLQNKHGTYNIRAGELFVIRPGEVTVYEADKSDPWHYCWIAFLGDRAHIFDTAPSVITSPDTLPQRLLGYIMRSDDAEEIYLSLLFELLYHLFRRSTPHAPRGDLFQICNYIKYNYMKDLQVASLAAAFGYERSYLYRLFKTQFGCSVKSYITNVRMEMASNFLRDGYPVCDTAHMVGFVDEFNFSKCFKKHFGISPSQFKRGPQAKPHG